MPKLLDRAVRLALALLVAGGLGIGASTAVAAIADPLPCTDYPPDKTCTNIECEFTCKQYFGSASTGECVRNCCICEIP